MTMKRVAVACAAGVAIAVAAAGQVGIPAASAQAPMPVGRFLWQDLMTTDVAAARTFYGALLGWTFSQTKVNDRPYLIAHTAQGPVGGIVDVRNLQGASSQWISYVSVPDLDAAVQRVQTVGGKTAVPAVQLKDGRAAIVVDPQGAALGLLQPTAAGLLRVPEPAAPIRAQFFWREYLAKDGPQALTFYKGLLGYDAASTDTQAGVEYFVLKRDRPRAGLFQMPADVTNVKPHWLPYIMTDDPAALAAKVAGLGGRVLLEPSADRRKGSLAIIADPTGGIVALQKFPF